MSFKNGSMELRTCYLSQGNPLRFLYSLLVASVLIASLVYTDSIKQQSLAREQRDSIATSLRETQLAFTSEVYAFVRNTLKSANIAHAKGEIDLKELQVLSEKAVAGGGRIVRLEYAPGFSTIHVLPEKGNEHRIGSQPSLALSDEPDQSAGDPRKVFPVVRRVRLLGNRAVEIGLLVPLLKKAGVETSVEGVMYVVARIHIELPMQINGEGIRNVDYLINWLPGGPSNAVVQPEWVTGADMGPVGGSIDIPGGSFILLARHADNWAPSFSEMLDHRLWMLIIGLPVFVLAILSSWFTFTRRSTRERLTEAKEQMSGVLENLTGAALTYIMPEGEEKPSAADRIIFLNKSACAEIWGVDADVAEADVMTLWDLVDVPGTAGSFSNVIAESARTMAPFHHVWPMHTLDGKLRWLDGRGYPRRLEDGSIQWSAIIFDTTERVKRDQELEVQRELAFSAQKNESIGQLTGGVAHDFNNHLAVILGNLELLLASEGNQQNKKLLDSAITATLHGADLTKNMLAFARKARLSPEILDLNEIIRDTGGWIGRTLPEAIAVETSLPSGIWKISADLSSTESSLLNLILNARDAMQGQGKLTIATSNFEIEASGVSASQEDLSPGRYVMLAITDTGQGIEKHLVDEIFEPFYSTKPTGQGTGLGLSMVMGFMRQSGGSIQVFSEPGHGTSFKLLFPAASSLRQYNKQAKSRSQNIAGRGRKILIAEDENEVRSVLVGLLEKAGYVVVEASSGDAAFAVFRENPDIDLLLSDIVMPGQLQGPGLAKAVREIRPELPVVFISGYANEATIYGNGLRSDDVRLMKPVQRRDLLAAVFRAIRVAASDSQHADAVRPESNR